MVETQPKPQHVTITQIAQKTGFSPATVSRVLNGKGMGFISDSTRRAILASAADLGYRPSRNGRSDRPPQTRVVSLWIRNPDAPYYAGILRALHDRAAAAGYETILRFFRDRPDAPARELAWLPPAGWTVDAVFAADCRQMAQTFLSAHPSDVTPLVGLGDDVPTSADHVRFDPEHGVREAVEHLVAIGCRRIAHLSARATINNVRTVREQTYATVVAAAGQSPTVIHAVDETRGAARRAIVDHVRSHAAPDGLFCLNDDMAIGAYRGLLDLGLRVPRDVALVGCDGIEDGEFLESPLTTILQPVDELCRVAWACMQQRLADPAATIQSHVLRPHLLIRESTRRSA